MKKYQKKKVVKESFDNPTIPNFLSDYVAQLKVDFDDLSKILFKWNLYSNGIYLPSNRTDLIKKYIKYHHQYYEYDQYNNDVVLLDNVHVNHDKIQSEDLIYKSYNIFRRVLWPVRFHRKFVAKINDMRNQQQLLYALGHICYYCSGRFPNKFQIAPHKFGHVKEIDMKTITFNRFFSALIYEEKNFLIQVGLQKVPVLSKNKVIKRYEFNNYIQFLDLLGNQIVVNPIKLNERMNQFTQGMFHDVAKRDHSDEVQAQVSKMSKQGKYFFTFDVNPYTNQIQYFNSKLNAQKLETIIPFPFKPIYVSSIENTSLVFDNQAKRWLSKDYISFLEKKRIVEYQRQINEDLVKRFVDFQSAKTLVDLLTKIPNFKINLTQQEKDVIGQNGNVMVIGRSGTGKTTCAVLRLFSIEMLFKIRLSLYKKKYQDTIKDTKNCSSDDIDQAIGLHCIFLTASPVLTHEIQRYYKKLTDNIKTQLEKKKRRVEKQRQKKEQQQKLQKQQEEIEILEPQRQQDIEIPGEMTKLKSKQDIQEESQLNNEFKDLQLEENLENQQFNESDEDIDELKQKFQNNINNFHSLFDLKQKDYPGFFTIRSFILMMDGVLNKPFFIRKKHQIVNNDSKSSWHNQRKGVMMIEDYFKTEGKEDEQVRNLEEIEEEINYSDQQELEQEYLRQIQLRENKGKQKVTHKLDKVNKSRNRLSFEVDYDYFIVHFWPQVKKKYYSARNITPHLVWTEIYSTIKGSAEAHQFPGQYLPQFKYMTATTNVFLTRDEKLDIYQTFCQYERWKIRAGGYDIMDAVNYILNNIRYRGYLGPELHYIMIDEVQDLPHAIVYLLSKTAIYGVFYSGDTAQTIAKGVGFRFGDLRNLFNPKVFDISLKLKAPMVKHLTVNFRSHNNILQLANSVISVIEILFPKTIDRLKKQVSDLSGPKPMILSESDQQLLFYVLCGGQADFKSEQLEGAKKPPLEFGCDQVIIVRDQQSKAKIPAMLQHALCLTIYEAKGLEFNDVILYNFFTESACAQKYGILKSLQVNNFQMEKQEYQKNMTIHKVEQQAKKKKQIKNMFTEQQQQHQWKMKEETEVIGEQTEVQQFFDKEKNVYNVKKIYSEINKNYKDINDYAEVCSELKLLYTAITRPKKTLIIFDEDSKNRKNLERIWEKLDVVKVISKQLIAEEHKKGMKKESQEVKIFDKVLSKTDNNSWKKQGLKMYGRGYFDQAMKCFEKSGNIELYKKAKANKLASDATNKLIEVESDRNAIKEKFFLYENMSKAELGKVKKELKVQEKKALAEFIESAQQFEDLLMFKQAGQCYFSGKQFQKAYENFCKSFMYKQAGESLEMQNKYREAAVYYEKDDEYLKVIECLDMGNEWTTILQKIHKYSHKMSENEKQTLLKKYSALALEELVYEIQFQNQTEENKPEKKMVEVIEEKESDQEEDSDFYDENEDPEEEAEKEVQRKKSQEIVDESKRQQSFSILNEKKQEKKQQSRDIKSIDMSFSDLNKSSQISIVQQSFSKKMEKMDLESLGSFSELYDSKIDDKLEPDLESIKSMVDPEDIWLKNSISDIQNKVESEYSVLDEDENYNINAKIIKTKGNIFVQEEIMKKIVNIVTVINTSAHEFFKQFKGYQSLITVRSSENMQENINLLPQISQFEDVDIKFINIVLDTLESFKLFKLCLFVCNRYHLPNKAGRYLLSLGIKYSTNCHSINTVNPVLLAPSPFRKNQIQKGILASYAMHAIYENVNSEFLRVKVSEKEENKNNTLGVYFIQGLILQGLYKKVVFMVNYQEAFKILVNYNDFDGYNSIFKQRILKIKEEDETKFMVEKPKTKTERQYTRLLLKKVYLSYCVVSRFETVSQRFYKEFNIELNEKKFLSEIIIPDYLPWIKSLLDEDITTSIRYLNEHSHECYQLLTKGNSVEVLDLVCFLMIIVHSEYHKQRISDILSNDSFLELFRCLSFIQKVLQKIVGPNCLKIMDSVLSLHQIYPIKQTKTMEYLNDSYCFVKRTTTLANELVQNKAITIQNKQSKDKKFAFFFEQDYNFILVKISKILKAVCKKYEVALMKFYRVKASIKKYPKVNFLPNLFKNAEEQLVINHALNIEAQTLQERHIKKKKPKKENVKITKKLKVAYNYSSHTRGDQIILNDDYESEESEEEVKYSKVQYVKPSFNPKMQYLSEQMLNSFYQYIKNQKSEIMNGKDFFCSNLNNSYRQYVEPKGGYNLFDAIQFCKFKRIDLYAQNILSVIYDVPLRDKHYYICEMLVLLLVQYKSLEEGKQFKIQLTRHLLKFLENLELVQVVKQETEKFCEVSTEYILQKGQKQCIFTHKYAYISELKIEQIEGLICEYLQIFTEEQASQFYDFKSIILVYVINIKSSKKINELSRKIINLLGRFYNLQSLASLYDAFNQQDYLQKRNQILTKQNIGFEEKMHQILVSVIGNNKIIDESQRDYEIQGRIIAGKKKAVNKISMWWKDKRRDLKKFNGNYYQYSVNELDKKSNEYLTDIRIVKTNHNLKYVENLNILLFIEQTKEDLLAFYLTNIVSSSLDFHFILITLNRIEELKGEYVSYFSNEIEDIHDEEQQRDLVDIENSLKQIIETIRIWKSDAKWLKDRNMNLKKKKVFQVKWMTKSLGFNKLIKKRAGLKKQEKLKQKKDQLKRAGK